MAVDANTGRVLYARNSDARRYPASLTKVMTLYLLFEFLADGKIDYNTKLYVTKHAASRPASKLGLKPGESIRVIDAIRVLVTKSANDVAAVVAENLAGTEANFAKLMTHKAHTLGMANTTYRNASGLPNAEQVTTARDMITLSIRIQHDFPDHYRLFRTKYFKYRGQRYRNHNSLLFNYKGADGIKTGYTHASGFNLTSSVRRGKKHVVAVVIGSKSAKRRDAQMRRILDRVINRASARSRKATPAPRRKPTPPVETPPMAKASAVRAANPVARARRGPADPHIESFEIVQIEEALDQERVDLARTSAISKRAVRPRGYGDFHVQVGAYRSATNATQQLSHVTSLAGDLLAGHQPLTILYRNPRRALYRARFAGFSRAAGQAACSRLRARDITCVVMRAE